MKGGGVNPFNSAARGGMLALALLVCGCVFAAVTGPAESLQTRTQALRETLAELSSPTKAAQATSVAGDFQRPIPAGAPLNAGPSFGIETDQLSGIKSQLQQDVAADSVPLAPGDWAGLSTPPDGVSSGYANGAYLQARPEMEVLYRDTLDSMVRVVAGSLSPPRKRLPVGTLAVSVTTQTAARFGLHPGSRLLLGSSSPGLGLKSPTLLVTGIVRAANTNSTFWTVDATALAPSLSTLPNSSTQIWVGAAFADPSQLDAMQDDFDVNTIAIQWEYPLDLSGVNADQVRTLAERLGGLTEQVPALDPELAPKVGDIQISSPLLQPLQRFVQTQQGMLAVLLLLFGSLVVVGAQVILLAARMIAARRGEELRMLRARGASLRQVAMRVAAPVTLVTVPAAALGVALARAASPHIIPLSWQLAVVVLIVALPGPPLIAAWEHRLPAPAVNPARFLGTETRTRRFTMPVLRRLATEVAACAGAVGGLVVLRQQGTASAVQGVNWYLTVAPVLVAVPAVLLTLRLYPLVIRGLLGLAGRRAGATSYLALANSARASLATVGPVFVLVLALTLAAFAGMVSDAVSRGQVAASWQATGADAVIDAGFASYPITTAVEHALAEVPGVTHETAVWHTVWVTPGGQQITISAVDPAGYSALESGTPFPRIPVTDLGPGPGPISVAASPAMAALLGSGEVRLTSLERRAPITIRVVQVVATTAAVPPDNSGNGFLIMAMMTLPGLDGHPRPDQILLTGAAIDRAQLAKTLATVLPHATVSYRSTVLARLRQPPLQHTAATLMLLTTAAAAAFGLLTLVLGLALGAPDRDLSLARLSVMGLAHPRRLVLAETLPALLTTAVAGLACALALPTLVGSAVDLSVFTGPVSSVTLTPGLVALGLPLAGMLLLAGAALLLQTRSRRRRGAAELLRAN